MTMASVAAAPSAQAGVSELANYPGYGVVVACKTAEGGIYGPVWRIQLVAASKPGKVVSGTIVVTRNGAYIGQTSATGRNGSWGVSYVYASATSATATGRRPDSASWTGAARAARRMCGP